MWAPRSLNRTPVSFWYVLRAAQISVVVQVLLGAILLVAGHEPSDAIHYMYGTAPLLVNLFAEGMRVGAAQREVPEDVEFEGSPADEQRTIALRIVRREMIDHERRGAARGRVLAARRPGLGCALLSRAQRRRPDLVALRPPTALAVGPSPGPSSARSTSRAVRRPPASDQ